MYRILLLSVTQYHLDIGNYLYSFPFVIKISGLPCKYIEFEIRYIIVAS